MAMAVAITASANPTTAFRCRINISKSQRQLLHSCSLFPRSHYRPLVIRSIKVPAAEHFGEPHATTNLHNLAERLQETFPKPLKEFPWQKAEYMLLERLLFLGKKALKWSFIVLFIASFISDMFLSVSTNRELMIPLGLFIGVTAADFLKESTQELYQSSTKDGYTARHLLGIGSFFLFVKFVSLCFKIQGRVLLSHIGNGGLMQILWSAKEAQQTKDGENQEEQTYPSSDASITSSLED